MSLELKLARSFAVPLDLVTEATAIVATRGAGKSSASAVIVEEAIGLDVQVVVFDRTGVYWGLRSNARGDGPGLGVYVLGGPHGDVPLEHGAGRLIADLVVDSGHSFVLDLSDFSKSAAIRFAADFLDRLYDRKARARTTTLLVLDEAHFYAPQTPRGGFKGDSARLMGAMEDVVGLGRSRGLGAVLTTQRTQALNKAILDLIETLLVMRMLSPRARDAVQGWIREKQEDDREGVIASLDSLPTGTAWVWSPLRGLLEKVAVRRIHTFDSYATPRPGETRVEPTARKELDLDALGEQMRSTAERVKAEDPRELRARIRELESQLARAPVEPEERVVEVIPKPFIVAVGNAVRQIVAVEDALASAVDTVRAALEPPKDTLFEALANAPEPQTARADDTQHKPSNTTPARPAGDGFRGAPRPSAQTNGKVSAPQQRVLDALAWFRTIGVTTPRRSPLGAVAGVSPKSSGFEKNLSTLRTAGLIDYPDRGRVTLTTEGEQAANAPDVAPTRSALHEAVCRMVSGPQATLLWELIRAWPNPLDRETLADRVGVSSASSGFEKNLSTLRSFELVDYPQRGLVRAEDLLFP